MIYFNKILSFALFKSGEKGYNNNVKGGMPVMKIDMHCHVKEGSIDSRVSMEEYIQLLQSRGFGGMVITDHDTYNGYRYWKKNLKDKKYTDFKVFKGIEYDTLGAGHILVIVPETIKLRILELRGLPLNILISIVHSYGGILGPAHPCGEKYLSFRNTRTYRRDPKIVEQFDFVEVFNACEDEESNATACRLAEKYHKPGVGGSDSHKMDCVGLAYTEVPDTVQTETDLINCIKAQEVIGCGGTLYRRTTKEKIGKVNTVLVYSFWFYNKFFTLVKTHKRNRKLRAEY